MQLRVRSKLPPIRQTDPHGAFQDIDNYVGNESSGLDGHPSIYDCRAAEGLASAVNQQTLGDFWTPFCAVPTVFYPHKVEKSGDCLPELLLLLGGVINTEASCVETGSKAEIGAGIYPALCSPLLAPAIRRSWNGRNSAPVVHNRSGTPALAVQLKEAVLAQVPQHLQTVQK